MSMQVSMHVSCLSCIFANNVIRFFSHGLTGYHVNCWLWRYISTNLFWKIIYDLIYLNWSGKSNLLLYIADWLGFARTTRSQEQHGNSTNMTLLLQQCTVGTDVICTMGYLTYCVYDVSCTCITSVYTTRTTATTTAWWDCLKLMLRKMPNQVPVYWAY